MINDVIDDAPFTRPRPDLWRGDRVFNIKTLKTFIVIVVVFIIFFSSPLVAANAPITYAPVITITNPGLVSVPITTDNFINIEAMSLSLQYDPAILVYQGTFTKNSALIGFFDVGSTPGPGNITLMTINWAGSASVSLPNGATILTLNFSYAIPTAATCALNWFDLGPNCEWATFNAVVLNDLPTSTYYHNGSVTMPLVANFSASNLTPPKNTTTSFTDLSSGGATTWNWSFNRPSVVFVNGTSATSQNPQVQFTDGGLYTVTLVVHNSTLSNSVTKPDYIRAGISGIWTGNTSSDWNTISNWDNYLTPTSSTDVVIPSTALNWPVFVGNLTLGTQCSTLYLSGATSKMTITGVLTIP
ncbi:MAG: PKD domain-containing protein [Bacteroidota bacterium]